jgi:hypothetical protein
MMEAIRTSETSVYYNETTRRYISEIYHLHPNLSLGCDITDCQAMQTCGSEIWGSHGSEDDVVLGCDVM